MHYALVWYYRKEMLVVSWKGSNDQSKERTIGAGLGAKLTLLEGIGAGDTLWVASGSSDAAAFRALSQGAQVFRLPTTHLKAYRNGASREGDARIVAQLARAEPQLFYPIIERDRTIAQLRALIRLYKMVQAEVRIPTELRLMGITRDLGLLAGTEVDVSDKALKQQVAEHPIFAAARAYEQELKGQLAARLKDLPLFTQVFDPIPYLRGPIIAATIIGEIGDISFFPSANQLAAYAGFTAKDGAPTKGGNRTLRQVLWLAASRAIISPHDNPWKALFQQRLLRERELHPEVVPAVRYNKKGEPYNVQLYTDAHLRNRATRWVAQKMLRTVYFFWGKFERGEPIPELSFDFGE